MCDEPRDRNRWNVYCHVSLRLFLLRKAIELLHAFDRGYVRRLVVASSPNSLSQVSNNYNRTG